MTTAFDTLKSLVRSEKGTLLEPQRKYLFEVSKRSNKVDIKRAVEEVYKVKVQSVNTFILPGKLKRVRQEIGRTSDWKKAIVTLHEGHKIEVT